MTAVPTPTLTAMAPALDQLAEAIRTASGTYLTCPAADSSAVTEIQDRSFDSEWSQQPTGEANAGCVMLMHVAVDHARSAAALLGHMDQDDCGHFAIYPVARSLLEVASRAWYLLEPGIGAAERVRRHMNERLWSLHERHRLIKGLKLDPNHYVARMDRILRGAHANGFTPHHGTDHRAPYVGKDPRPNNMTLIEAVMNVGGTTGQGAAQYRLLSATSHGAVAGLADLLKTVALPLAAEGFQFRQAAHTPVEAAQRLVAPVISLVTAGDRLFQHYGWNDADWRSRRVTLLTMWGRLAS